MAPCCKRRNELVALPQKLRELLQLRLAQVGSHPVRVVRRRPMEQVIALAVAGLGPATWAARWRASVQLPSATAASDAARASGRHTSRTPNGRGARARAPVAAASRTRSRRAAGA